MANAEPRGLQIWVDADACPAVIKEILFRAAIRTQLMTTLVANQLLRVPPSPYIRALQVPGGFDVADDRIVELLAPGDLVITADIPLAAQVIAKGGHALNLMEELRGSGVELSGPSAFNHSDRQAFAAELDRFLARNLPR